MLKFAGMLGAFAALALSIPVAGQQKAAADAPGDLVQQLGSKSFAAREQATRALDAMGAAALPALRQAAGSRNLEIRRRAAGLLRNVERRVEAAKLLAPPRVRLVYKDTPIAQAVADLGKRTGLTLKLAGDRDALARRKVTLDTGEVPLWEAYDLFCRAAGLAEEEPVVPAPQPVIQQGGVSVRIVGIRGGGGFVPETVDVLGKAAADELPEFTLRPGTPGAPTHFAGAVRVRALSAAASAPARSPGELLLHLDVTATPTVRWREVVGIKLARALDDQGQALKGRLAQLKQESFVAPQRGMVVINGRVVTAPNERPKEPSRLVPVRFTPGPKPTKSLKELSGLLVARVQSAPEVLVSVPDIATAAGKKFTGPQGAWVQVHEVRRDDDRSVTLRVEVAAVPQELSDGVGNNELMLNVMINGKRLGEPERLLSDANFGLLDARGHGPHATRAVYTRKHTATSQEYELTYPAAPGAALRFVYRDRRSAIVEVPFTLKDVPLH